MRLLFVFIALLLGTAVRADDPPAIAPAELQRASVGEFGESAIVQITLPGRAKVCTKDPFIQWIVIQIETSNIRRDRFIAPAHPLKPTAIMATHHAMDGHNQW